MLDFIETPASKDIISNRKPVYGIGINDATHVIDTRINGRRVTCPYYQKWNNMLERCYSKRYKEKRSTYEGCTVVKEWLIFSNFKEWMKTQSWQGMALDKDIIKPENKIYSPENCCFITRALNNLLTDHAAKRGLHPQGVSFYKPNGKYLAQITVNSKNVGLGYHATPEQASATYIKAKVEIILDKASEQSDPRVANGLRLHAELLANS